MNEAAAAAAVDTEAELSEEEEALMQMAALSHELGKACHGYSIPVVVGGLLGIIENIISGCDMDTAHRVASTFEEVFSNMKDENPSPRTRKRIWTPH